MDRLDFRRAAYGAVAALDYLAGRPDVDPSRLALWGYCTGASVALLAAGLRPGVAATVLFYPSQPRFEVNDRTRPIDPIDLIWNVDSSVLLLLGEDDFVWPPELVAEVRTRFDRWDVDHVIRTYAGAGHAFCAPSPMFHHAEASAAAWADALDHLATRLGARGTTA
jgi:carboxymethylenebutenolidase